MSLALTIAVGLLLLPVLILFAECILAMIGRTGSGLLSATRLRLAVLIPAHDEQDGIGATLAALLPQLLPGDRLVVVADNCTDSTAAVSRQAGAEVTERVDPERRGKGYALEHGIRFLESDPPEVVVIVDADCQVLPGTLDAIGRAAAQWKRPVQAVYLMDPPQRPSLRDLISAFAFRVRNLVRPLGLHRLGMPCLLTGTGMAIPWPAARLAMAGTGNIVEDMQLGLDLALAGHPPMLLPGAQVRGRLPSGAKAAATQRRRWEHGHLRTILTQVPRLLLAAVVQGRVGLLGLALDLMVPPLSLLVMLWAALWGLSAASWLAGFSRYPFVMASAGGVLLALAVLLAWARFARDLLPLRSLLAAPVYAAWKLPLYLAFAISREKRWIRTERGGGGPGAVP